MRNNLDHKMCRVLALRMPTDLSVLVYAHAKRRNISAASFVRELICQRLDYTMPNMLPPEPRERAEPSRRLPKATDPESPSRAAYDLFARGYKVSYIAAIQHRPYADIMTDIGRLAEGEAISARTGNG
jgi:hypothetical protein